MLKVFMQCNPQLNRDLEGATDIIFHDGQAIDQVSYAIKSHDDMTQVTAVVEFDFDFNFRTMILCSFIPQ